MFDDYITLNVGSVEGAPRRSLRRAWNQLSRLQRSIIYVIGIIFLCIIVYLLHVSKKPEEHIVYNALKEPSEVEKEVPDKKEEDSQIEENKIVNNVNVEEHNIEENEIDKEETKTPERKPKRKIFQGPQNTRQHAVVSAFKHAWKGYKKHAWGHDMLKPISKHYHDWFSLGLSIVDALDTMYIMGLDEEFNEARDWVKKDLHFNVNKDVNLFEVTIRVLGGLLSAYHLSKDRMFLEKALDLGTRLLPCFDTESGVPYSDINLVTQRAHSPKWSPDSSTSEVTTIQLEFRDLSKCTGNSIFEEKAARVSAHIHDLEKTEGLVPIFINSHTGDFIAYSTITLGARGDSYYEYLLKQWIQTGRTVDYLKEDYIEAIDGVRNLLVRRTTKNHFLFIGELLAGGKDFKPKMDHLTCYLSGTLALGVHYGMPQDHMDLAEELLQTCYQTYAIHPTFMAPEISYFNIKDGAHNDINVKTNDAHSLLRPEFIESLWFMYQITGNSTYQDWGWNIFQGFEKHAKVPNGYTSIGNVKNVLNTRPRDMMESFFLGETLKYLYLLFSDDRKDINIEEYVMNTEAHPLPIYNT